MTDGHCINLLSKQQVTHLLRTLHNRSLHPSPAAQFQSSLHGNGPSLKIYLHAADNNALH